MGFLDERCATLLSLAPVRRQQQHFSKEKALADRDDDQEAIRNFDILDSMERGVAHELVADFTEALPDSSRLWRFHVRRSDDRQEYRLYCDSNEFLMYAKASRRGQRVDIFLYDPAEKDSALFDPSQPAFTLLANAARSEWRLRQERCDYCRNAPQPFVCAHCRGKEEKMVVCHSSAEVGEGVNHCMEVHLPPDGCSLNERCIVSKLPVWNNKLECLVLDFKGRKITASAKNFQLAAEGDPAERVLCQYGKLSNNTFSLDFRYPLTVSQAFGLSLTTLFWT